MVKDINKLYKLEKELGSGCFGTVYQAQPQHMSGIVAVKVINKNLLDPKSEKNLESEVKTLTNISHPNIVKVIDICEDSKAVYIVTELVENGDLLNVLETEFKTKPLKEGDIAIWIQELLVALNYLHKEKKIIHRDLKLENVLMDYNT